MPVRAVLLVGVCLYSMGDGENGRLEQNYQDV
jgi:hypothetical protein